MLEILSMPPMDDALFERLTRAVLAHIESQMDAWLQDDVLDIDCNRTGGLLELTLPDHSKVVINTQPPLHELWLASRAAGRHFKWTDGAWRDTRDGREFFSVLSEVLSQQSGQALRVTAPD